MAVELDTNLIDSLRLSDDLFFNYEKEEALIKWKNTSYGFSEDDSQSHIQFKQNKYIPVCIHLTTKLHKGLHDFEMHVEHVGNSVKENIILTFPLKVNSVVPELTFPLENSPLEKIMNVVPNKFSYYKTSTNNHVFFCTRILNVGDKDIPKVLDNPKTKYKEIFEPTSFDIFSNLMTRNDYNKKKIHVLSGNVRFSKLSEESINLEGFKNKKKKKKKDSSRYRYKPVDPILPTTRVPVVPAPVVPVPVPVIPKKKSKIDSSYMECELLATDAEGGEIQMSEYALTPLNANYYERGLVTFITSLHFLLIICVGGFILPYFQSHCRFTKGNKYNSAWYYFFTFVHYSFLFISVIMMSVGLKNVKKSKKRRKTDRKVVATVGLYFLFLFLSNAVGMAIQFPTSGIYDKNYDKTHRPEDENYTWVNRAFNPLMKIKSDRDDDK